MKRLIYNSEQVYIFVDIILNLL